MHQSARAHHDLCLIRDLYSGQARDVTLTRNMLITITRAQRKLGANPCVQCGRLAVIDLHSCRVDARYYEHWVAEKGGAHDSCGDQWLWEFR